MYSQDFDPNQSGLPAIAPFLLDTPDADHLRRLCESNPDYVSYMLRQLARQLQNGEETVREYFSEEDGIILNSGRIAQFCLLFQGFVATGGVITQEIGVPVFDIEVPNGWVFDLTASSTQGNKASFAIKIMGLAGGYGSNRTVHGSVSVPRIGTSCQAQVWATIQWRKYERAGTGETIYVGNVTNVVDGMIVRRRDDPDFRPVYADRYARTIRKFGATPGGESGKYDYFIEREASDSYSFDMPVAIGEFAVSTFTVTMSSTCQSKIALAAEFPMAVYEIRGPTDNPVVVSIMKAE
ncbi:MAG: hypothetical protein WD767_13400 [Alphaproteobacteria bacterium]